MHLDGKRALITGSTAGLGTAIAKVLATEGASVLVHGRREEAAREVVEEIRADGGEAGFVLGDLSDDDGAAAAAAAALEAFGGIDILINNVGVYFSPAPWLESDANEWVSLYDLNVGGQVRLGTKLIPGMRERGWGRVIAIGSAVGANPSPDLAAYSATKAAILNISVGLAKDLAGTGVTSNCISPGMMLTEGALEFAQAAAAQHGWSDRWDDMQAEFTTIYAPNPTGTIGRIEDVASFVAFVASPLAAYINGANLRVDGGFSPTVN
jgi:3-oxoacyl-[acyl-carrier protein] reductase